MPGNPSKVRRRSRRVALALPIGVPHLERVVHGIQLFGRQHAGWNFVTSPETHSIPVASLSGWDGDGVIALVNTAEELRVVRTLRCRVVNLSGALATTAVPRVRVDYEAAGRLAAEHLLRRGFERFAFYGLRGVFYAQACLEGFRREIEQHDGHCAVYEDESTIGLAQPWRHDNASLEKWLASLERPVGIMASHDPRAVLVAQACRLIGLRVPAEVAIIGLNNDMQTCEHCDPPLSSVSRPGERIGLEAAALLDRLMRGERPPVQDIVIPPEGVVERASTDTIAISGNEELSTALRYIHEHIERPFGVEEILDAVSVSRRWLEMAFKKKLRCTPHAYVLNLRIARAKEQLKDARRLRLKQVAWQCGFGSTRQLNIVFQRITGMSPRDFAARNQSERRGGAGHG